MVRKFVWCNRVSDSAKALANAIGAKRIKRDGSRYRTRDHDYVINWGSTTIPEQLRDSYILNSPAAVSVWSDKINAFNAIAEYFEDVAEERVGEGNYLTYPSFTTSYEQARRWINDGCVVVERHLLRSHGGRGIKLVSIVEELDPNVQLYVKYIKKKEEYRVHFGPASPPIPVYSQIISIQRKARRIETPDNEVNWQIRNHENGFIYAAADLPEEVKLEIAHFAASTQLHFGAIDIAWNREQNKYYILEVNTAPGIEGSTLEKYRDHLSQHIVELENTLEY